METSQSNTASEKPAFVVADGKLGDDNAPRGAHSGDDDLKRVEVVEPSEDPQEALLGWRKKNSTVSLQESNSTIRVPPLDAPWYKQWAAYVGVGFMISVG